MAIHNAGIFYAVSILTAKLDAAQRGFLREVGLSESQAFLDHNFAPPVLRRCIGLLGVLQKRVIGKCHPIFEELLPFFHQRFGYARPGHNKQLYGHYVDIAFQRELLNRSVFGLTHIYNRLPQQVVDCKHVKSFQTELTKIARTLCENEANHWQSCFAVDSTFNF